MKRLFLIAILLLGATAMHVIIASHYDHPDGPGVDDLYINFDHTDINENHSEEKFHLFVKPNPSSGTVQVATGLGHSYPLTVFSLTGQPILRYISRKFDRAQNKTIYAKLSIITLKLFQL